MVENRVQAWDLYSGRQLLRWTSHDTIPLGDDRAKALPSDHAISFAPAGDVFAVATSHNNIRCYDLPSGRECGLWKLESGARAIALDPTGLAIATVEENNSIDLNDLRTGRPMKAFDAKDFHARAVAFTLDGRLIVSGIRTQSSWDLSTGTSHQLGVLTDYRNPANETGRFVFSHDGRLAATGSNTDPLVTFWDETTGTKISSTALSAQRMLGSGDFSPDGKLVALYDYGITTDAPKRRSLVRAESLRT